MFHFPKFCRICIKMENGKYALVDVNTIDYDSVRLCEKLRVCSNMEINKDSLSTLICTPCIKKLRTAYEFRNMCQKSTVLLQEYLTELLSATETITVDKFVNSELRVSLIRLPNIDNKQNLITKYKAKKEPKYSTYYKERYIKSNSNVKNCPMKDLIDFSKSFEFGNKPESSASCPIEELTKFSERFFKTDFTDYNNTILHIRNGTDNWTFDDDCFEDDEDFESETSEEGGRFKEIVTEPCIKIESEFYDHDSNDSCLNTSDLVEACYYQEEAIKQRDEMKFSDAHEKKLAQLFRTGIGTDDAYKMKGRRCRTQGCPVINPQLQKQFLLRNFSCRTCCRQFKSPGYLKNHINKLNH